MKSITTVLALCIFLLSLTLTAQAKDVTLSWDESPSSSVIGYNVYYDSNSNTLVSGEAPPSNASSIDAGDNLSAIIYDLDNNTDYYFAVTAYDSDGNESVCSNIEESLSTTASVGSGGPELLQPDNSSTNLTIPVTLQWEPSSDYSGEYTIVYGTDQDEVEDLAITPLTGSRPEADQRPQWPLLVIASLLAASVLLNSIKNIKTPLATCTTALLCTALLVSCGGGGGGDGSSSSSGTISATVSATDTELLSVTVDGTDYYDVYELEDGETYYWKVVATDATDESITYESEVRSFTTEEL